MVDTSNAAETDGVRNIQEILKEDVFVDAEKNASRHAETVVQRVGEVHEL